MDLLRSLPIGLYLEQPITWLHRLDARVKLVWLMTFLIAPVLASSIWRLVPVILLILITLIAGIPMRAWKQQMGMLLIFCTLVFILSATFPDGLAVTSQPRLPPDELAFGQQPATLTADPSPKPWYQFWQREQTNQENQPIVPVLPQPTTYNYVLWQQGPLKITRRAVDLGIRVSTLFFTVVYSTTLYLLTTASEEVTTAIEYVMRPLQKMGLPTIEIALTLTLSLRFIPLVLEEIQNLIRAIRTRAINWKKLGWRRAVQIWLTIAERLLENLLLRAAQIADAMKVRGFTSPDRHQVQWHQLHLRKMDWLALALLIVFWTSRLAWGWQ